MVLQFAKTHGEITRREAADEQFGLRLIAGQSRREKRLIQTHLS